MYICYLIIAVATALAVGTLIGKYYAMKRKKRLLNSKYAVVWSYSKW